MATDRKVGLALGGGGARGLAHILMLEVLEELGIRPHRIAGTSIGAIVGSLAASGLPAAEIRQSAEALVRADFNLLGEWFQGRQLSPHWLQLLSIEWGSGGLLNPDRFFDELQQFGQLTTFDALPIPLTIVAADYWTRQQVVFDSGDVLTAVHGSMAVPGIFAPVPVDDWLLIDGGTVNPVPFDLLLDDCDLTIAIDVLGSRGDGDRTVPSVIESVLSTFQVMEQAIITEKLSDRAPDIYVRPEVTDVRVLEFNKLDQILTQALPARDQLRRELEALL